jgi:hypothetical protein
MKTGKLSKMNLQDFDYLFSRYLESKNIIPIPNCNYKLQTIVDASMQELQRAVPEPLLSNASQDTLYYDSNQKTKHPTEMLRPSSPSSMNSDSDHSNSKNVKKPFKCTSW